MVDTITGEINSRVDVEDLTKQALTALTDLTPPTGPGWIRYRRVGPGDRRSGRRTSSTTPSPFRQSAQFEDLWVAANRAAHNAVVAVVTGETNTRRCVDTSSGTISIELGPIIDR